MSWEPRGRSQFLGRARGKIKEDGLFNQGFVRWIAVCLSMKEGRGSALQAERKLCANKKSGKRGSRETLSQTTWLSHSQIPDLQKLR